MGNTNNQTELNKTKIEKVTGMLKAIAHPTRLAVLQLLDTSGAMNVNELMAKTDCEQSLLSHHLANMRAAGLLKSDRKGQNIYYSIKETRISEVVNCIEKCDIQPV